MLPLASVVSASVIADAHNDPLGFAMQCKTYIFNVHNLKLDLFCRPLKTALNCTGLGILPCGESTSLKPNPSSTSVIIFSQHCCHNGRVVRLRVVVVVLYYLKPHVVSVFSVVYVLLVMACAELFPSGLSFLLAAGCCHSQL